MNLRWLPGKSGSIALLIGAAMTLIWGTVLGGYAWEPIRPILRALPYGDKVGHFALYGAITLATALLVRTRQQAIGAAVAVILIGVGDEFRQLLEPRRNFSIGDVLANLGGISLGLLVALMIMRIVATSNSKHSNP